MKFIAKYFLLALIVVATAACDKFDGKPAYLHIEAVDLVDNPSDSWSQESGFFTSLIDAVNIIIWVDGDDAETNLGMFQLPCTIPVLRDGNIDRIDIVPVVKQNGIAGTRIPYPFFEKITINNVRLTVDSTTDLGHVQTRYISKSIMKVLWQEYFEPGPGTIKLDTVVQRLVYKPDTVCSGYGCGVVRINDSVKVVNFWSDTTINVSDPSAVLYLEMDYWSDLDFTVGLRNPQYAGATPVAYSIMTLYGRPEAGWQKIYINLGKLWGQQYNHYPDIRLYFSLLNPDGKGGNLYLDNMKLVMM